MQFCWMRIQREDWWELKVKAKDSVKGHRTQLREGYERHISAAYLATVAKTDKIIAALITLQRCQILLLRIINRCTMLWHLKVFKLVDL